MSAPADALEEGIYGQDTTLGELKEHGDFGPGTFNDLDGEMVLLGGSACQIAGKGQARRPGDLERAEKGPASNCPAQFEGQAPT